MLSGFGGATGRGIRAHDRVPRPRLQATSLYISKGHPRSFFTPVSEWIVILLKTDAILSQISEWWTTSIQHNKTNTNPENNQIERNPAKLSYFVSLEARARASNFSISSLYITLSSRVVKLGILSSQFSFSVFQNLVAGHLCDWSH